MSLANQGFLADLEARANAAQAAEIAYRNSVAGEIARRERAREFAFRRLAFARSMALAVKGAQIAPGTKSADAAFAAQQVALKNDLGWNTETDSRKRILAAWKDSVARAVLASLEPPVEGRPAPTPAPESVPDALAAFEAWYLKEFGTEFLALLDYELPEVPVVEF